jgi:hypothetical protein
MQRKHAGAIIVFAALFLIPSCGPNTGTVTGVVTYNEKKLTHGTVVFIGADGIPISAQINEDGTYEAKGVLYGECFVAVSQTAKGAKSAAEIRKEYQDKDEVPPPEVWGERTNSTIPIAYSNAQTSALKLTVSQRNTTYDIPLVDKEDGDADK